MRLIVATHNAHKTGEIAEILKRHFDACSDLTAVPDMTPPVEDGDSFEANARIKARAAAATLAEPDTWILADDSGIEVDALDGAPGIHSARYAGEDASDAANRDKLLAALDEAGATTPAQRRGRFRCVLVLLRGAEEQGVFQGTVEGTLADANAGDHGFGYDPLFIPEGHTQTFGQLPAETKHALSHRGRALETLKQWLESFPEPV